MDPKILERICKAIRKSYGDESINYLGNKEPVALPRFTTQCPQLDQALGGGIPVGRIIEVYGVESSGKSTFCLHCAAEAQKMWKDVPVALVDVEYSFDPIYAQAIGVNVGELLVSQPDNGTEALNILISLIEQGVKLIIVDSVAALMPKEEETADLGENQMGLQARMISKALRKINSLAGRNGVTIIFTNQIREKIGVTYGDKTTTPGGRALRFYASCRIKMASTGQSKEGEEKVASIVQATITKNKTAPPFRKAVFTIRYGVGIDRIEDLMTLAIAGNVIKKKGGWFEYDGANIAQGRGALRKLIISEEVLREALYSKVKDMDLSVLVKPDKDEESEDKAAEEQETGDAKKGAEASDV